MSNQTWETPGLIGLWSLLDMLKISAQHYINIGRSVGGLAVALMMLESGAGSKDLLPDESEEFGRLLAKLHKDCTKLGLVTSAEIVKQRLNDFPRTSRELQQLLDVVKSELGSRLFLYMPPDKAAYYDDSSFEQILGFPLASEELIRARRCYALGESTASVFHSMRAAEIGLRVVATAIKISLPVESAQWQTLIEQIESAVGKLSQQPKSKTRDDDMTFYSGCAAQFRYFKDAFRNHVSHARVSYDENQSLKIIEHVADMLRSLVPRLDEA